MASPPSAEATLHPSFGAIGEARQAAIAARSTFFDERIRDGFSELLLTAGTACTRCCRHAATAHARSCQAEIAADAEPQRLSLGSRKARGLGLLHGRRLYRLRPHHALLAPTPSGVAPGVHRPRRR